MDLYKTLNILYEVDGNKTFKFTLPGRPGSLFMVEEAEWCDSRKTV